MSIGRNLLWIIVSLTALGCNSGSTPSINIYSGPTNICKSDGDCLADAFCHAELRVCAVAVPENRRVFHLRVKLNGKTDEMAQVFTIELGADGVLAEPVEISNTVNVAGNIGMDAKVVFTETGITIPGRPGETTTSLSHNDSRPLNTNLVPGRIYRMQVIPTGEEADTFPITVIDGLAVDEDGKITNSDGTLVSFDQLKTKQIEGFISRGGLKTYGLTVDAIVPNLGANAQVISTSDVTSCDAQGKNCGYFSIRVAEGSQFSLRVGRPEQPGYPVEIISDVNGDSQVNLDLLPLPGPLLYKATVEADNLNPVPGCLVIFSGTIAGGQVNYVAQTNESGKLERAEGKLGVFLYPGGYKVRIVPPLANQSVYVEESINISDKDISGGTFTLNKRVHIWGDVFASDKPLPTSPLEAHPLQINDFIQYAYSSTNSAGAYDLWVDQGEYLFVVKTPSMSGYPWIIENVTIENDQMKTLKLPLPFIARATLTSLDEEVDVGGATVEWFSLINESQAHLVAHSYSDKNGKITTLIAP